MHTDDPIWFFTNRQPVRQRFVMHLPDKPRREHIQYSQGAAAEESL
jgi:hypothetical protein